MMPAGDLLSCSPTAVVGLLKVKSLLTLYYFIGKCVSIYSHSRCMRLYIYLLTSAYYMDTFYLLGSMYTRYILDSSTNHSL